MSIKIIVTIVLFLLVSAQLHNKKHLQITLLNPVYMNADNQQNIIVGGSKGQIEVFTSQKFKMKSTIYEGICKSSIIFIEWLQINTPKQFVVVDSLGTISVWRKGTWTEIQNIQLNKNIVSVSSKIEQNINDTRLALNAGDQIIQISFSPLKVVKRWNINLPVNIKELKYAGNQIVALGEDFNIYRQLDSSTQLQVMPLSYNSFEFLHILRIDNEFHIIGIANSNLQVSFTLSGRSHHQTKQITNEKVKSFKISRSRKRNGSESFIHQQPHFLVELSDNNLQVRSLTDYIQSVKIEKQFISVQFYDDQMIVLDENQIEVIQLDHEAHNQIRYAGFAFLPLSIVIIMLAFWKNVQQKSKIQKEKATNVKEIQLQQMLISKDKKKEHIAY